MSEFKLPKPGDIILFSGIGWKSWLVEGVTCSPFSHIAHCAYITKKDLAKTRPVRKWKATQEQINDWQDGLYIVESTTLGNLPCAIQGIPFSGVQVHSYEEYVRSYYGKVWLMPLIDALSSEESQRLTDVSLDLVGKPYDTAGAGLSGTRLLKHLCFWRTADRSTVFCAEDAWVCLSFTLQGRLLPLVDPGEVSPRGLVDVLSEWYLYGKPQLQAGLAKGT